MTDVVWLGSPRRHYAECASTNDLARAWALDPTDPAPRGALVTADFQTRGRGQRGRRWYAQAGESLLMSLVLRPDLPVSQAGRIGLTAALAVADALAEFHTVPRLKWPNDVLLDGKKAAGILVETVLGPTTPTLGAAIVGIGLNVAQTDFGESETGPYVYPPTSLRLVTGQTHSVEDVLQAVLRALERRLSEEFPAVLAGCRERLATGTRVRRGGLQATLASLNDDGSARVCLPDGTFADWTSVDG